MSRLHLTARLRRSLRNRGIIGSLRHYGIRAYRVLRPHPLKPHPFDLEHGVQTNAYIQGSALGTGHAHDIYNTAYYPSAPSVVRSSIDAWRSFLLPSDPPLESYSFLDIGAGLGRAVMVASLYPFEQAIGIEISPVLTEQAKRNLAIWLGTTRPCSRLEIATCDATEFPWPRKPLLIYMFNPFEEPVISRLLGTLEQALTAGAAPIDILYLHPVCSSVLEAHPKVRIIATTICYLSKEDGAVDFFSDPRSAARYECRIYRFAQPS